MMKARVAQMNYDRLPIGSGEPRSLMISTSGNDTLTKYGIEELCSVTGYRQ